ncbi:dihydrofolate reductase family protein [Janibacter limosus]|jgi:dihydrofolate reductase|uniref:Dihydrofolate reductase n=1 Tax=Janibacter limosus TaxID=53458 RepID=A0A4P6MTS5_9MICO|nr:dihydrofolate reductase family protein [Janibacter limosus]QBF47054.1 dihydrofolate reductase [Janibacter limosus]
MRQVTYSMGSTLDGYVVGPDGGFDWSVPDEEVFAQHLHDLRGTSVHLLGRRLHETMLFWESDGPDLDPAELEWGRRWRALPKVVFSTTLTEVTGSNTRLAEGGLAEEIERLRSESDTGEIAVGGAELAAEAAELDLIDEYRLFVHPVLVGGGRTFFPELERQVSLELVSSRAFGSGVVASRYRVVR